MQFIYLFAAGGLMKSVNILSDNCRELAGRFQSSKRQVGRPGLCVRIQHSFPVEPEKTGGILCSEVGAGTIPCTRRECRLSPFRRGRGSPGLGTRAVRAAACARGPGRPSQGRRRPASARNTGQGRCTPARPAPPAMRYAAAQSARIREKAAAGRSLRKRDRTRWQSRSCTASTASAETVRVEYGISACPPREPEHGQFGLTDGHFMMTA